MKKLSILCFILMSFCVFAQTKGAHAIKIYLEDAETGKNISDAKVTLEGFEIPAITAKYDKKEKTYCFKNSDYDNYDLVYVDRKNKEPQVFKKKGDFFPSKVDFKLYDKGIIVKIDTSYRIGAQYNYMNGTFYDKSKIDRLRKHVFTLDHHKILIQLKNSSKMTYSEIRAKIDSLVEPYGLEYIDDLVPKMYFIRFYGLHYPYIQGASSVICSIGENRSLKTFFKENPERIGLLTDDLVIEEDTSTDFFSENEESDPYNSRNTYDWSKNCYILPYRKKNKDPFRLENDPVLNRIHKYTTQLEFGKIKYDKLYTSASPSYDELGKQLSPSDDKGMAVFNNLNTETIKQLDAIVMNYKFLKKYNNDFTRLMLMDYRLYDTYLGEKGLHGNGMGTDMMGHWAPYRFVLDEDPNGDRCDEWHYPLRRYIGYDYLFK